MERSGQLQLGHWYLRGDFNPAAALPVWPLLEWCVFSFTGVSLIAARALSVSVFGATLLVACLLMAAVFDRWPGGRARWFGCLRLRVSRCWR